MKYKVTLSQEIIYEWIVIADDEDSAVKMAEEIFEENSENCNKIYSEFEAVDVKEIKE